MTNKLITEAMFQILSLAPMGASEARFRELTVSGDPDAFWRYYEACLGKPEMDRRIEGQGLTSFRMLKPAIEAVYRLKG